MKTKKINLKEKGITLVALVVTIIIMLILAGVTLNIALGENGLFQMTKKAVGEYQNKANEEENTLKEMGKELQYAIEGYVPEPDRSMPKVGDEVNYTPRTSKTTYTLEGNKSGYGIYTKTNPKTMTKAIDQEINQEKYTWKIMDINSKTGEVKIVGVPTGSMKNVLFQGALGYNNGVYLLDEMCKELYSNSDLGVIARSIDIDDIESKMNDKGRDAKNTYISENQTTKEFNGSNAYYPNIYKYQQDSNIDGTEKTEGISESDDGTKTEAGIPISHETDVEGYTQAETSITVKGTSYYVEQKEEYYDDKAFYNLIFNTNISYWIASRFSHCLSSNSCAYFGLLGVSRGSIAPSSVFGSSGDSLDGITHFCPVVSLGPDIKITREGNEGAWNLSKN